MSHNYGLTPEEMLKKKKRDKYLLYSGFIVFTTVISAVVTIFVSKI